MKEAATSMETSLLAAEKGQNSGVWIYLARTCRLYCFFRCSDLILLEKQKPTTHKGISKQTQMIKITVYP